METTLFVASTCKLNGGGEFKGKIHTYTAHCGKCPFLAVPSHFSSASEAYGYMS